VRSSLCPPYYYISKSARRAQILANRKLGFGCSSREDAKSAKIGKKFFLTTLRPFPFAKASGNGPKLAAKEPLRLCESFPRFGCGSAAL
jgi:hypothetical protein